MTRDRITQLVALFILIVSIFGAGFTLPRVLAMSDQHSLRYTDVAVEGAPPFVAVGQAIGVLRGLIVDYLWIKVNLMKERGLYFEVMADADLITKLQPRFGAVWAFHGHNMAYNISVATHTQQERWEWVNAGIRLVRNQGIRYNPNDLTLHRELAFWFAHKIEGVADDAHLYYKTEFCREWHFVLGRPPEDYQDRIEWIRGIAEAPETLAEAERRTPGVLALIKRIEDTMDEYRRRDQFKLDSMFLRMHGEWEAVTDYSVVAQMLGFAEEWRRTRPLFRAFDEIANDPEAADAWKTLLQHVRKRVLKDDYNMDPALMLEITERFGPVDWRHGQAHALYWSFRGTRYGEPRVLNVDDIYKVINNDRVQLQAMQDLARSGRISFDPFSNELPSRFPDPRWVDTIAVEFERVYQKHFRTRGAGGETFITFLQNFMSSAIREAYRAGETARAQRLMDMMDNLFGRGQQVMLANNKWSLPLDVFVREETRGEYQFQPHLAPSDVAAALRYGMRFGIGQNRPELYEQALTFARYVTDFFKYNEYNNFVNRFGEARIGGLIAQLEVSTEVAFLQLMTDSQIRFEERMTIWREIERYEPELRLRTYDRIYPEIERQFQNNPLSQRTTLAAIFPAPRGLEAYRVRMAEERARREAEIERARARDEIGRR